MEACHWCIRTAIGVFLYGILYYLCKKTIFVMGKKICKKTLLDKTKWKKIFFPVVDIIFCFLAGYYVLSQVGEEFGYEDWIQYLDPLQKAIFVLLLFLIIYRAKEVFLQKISSRGVHALGKILSIFLLLLVSLIILRIFHVDIIPLLAFGGIGAAALGFAAKDVMSSFFSGIVLTASRSFAVGDQILIPEKDLEGYIEEIGWNVMRVRSKDRCAVYLPNTLFSQLLVMNLSQRTGRRILETFPLRHEDLDKIQEITKACRADLIDNDHIDHDVPILVFFDAVTKYSLDFVIDVYTKATSLEDYVAIKDEVLGNIATHIAEKGAKIAHCVAVIEE